MDKSDIVKFSTSKDLQQKLSTSSDILTVVGFSSSSKDENQVSSFLKKIKSSIDHPVVFCIVGIKEGQKLNSEIADSSTIAFFSMNLFVDHFDCSDEKIVRTKVNDLYVRLQEEATWTRTTQPSYTGIRKKYRDLLLHYVVASNPIIRQCQIGHYKAKTRFFQVVSITGNHNFLIILFTFFLFGLGHYEMGRQIFLLLASGVLAGNMFKDYFCLPRPVRPVERLSGWHNKEFGFPSTHSVTAFCVPFFLIYKMFEISTSNFWIAMLGGLIYTYIVSYSRIYLGMHSIPDVLGGIFLGMMILIWWIYSGFSLLEYWVLHGGSWVPIYVTLLAAVLLTLHPEPYDFCPCFEDSVCFTSSAAGIVAGASRYPFYTHQLDYSLHLIIARHLTGTLLIFSVRIIMKALVYRILPPIYRTFSPYIPRRRFLTRFKPNQKVDPHKVIDPYPSIAHPKGAHQVHYDIDIPAKFVVYLAMGWVGAEGAEPLFWLLNLN